MNIQVEDINETRKKAVAQVSGEEITQAEKELVDQFAKQAQIKGFRPGKAPLNLIKSRYKNDIAEDLKRKLMGDAYKQAVNDAKLDILNVVEVGEAELVPGEAAEFSFTVDIYPQFELPEYKGIPVELPPTEATEEEFKRTHDYIFSQRAEYKPVEKAAAKGDYVRVDYIPTLDGQPIDQLLEDYPMYATQKGTWEEAGSDESVPGVRAVTEGIIGMQAGDEKTVEETLPESFEVEELRGKTVTYAVTVHEVREKILPTIDEEFLKSFGVETEAEFEQRLRDDIKSQKEQRNEGMKREQLMQALGQRVDFPLPESAVEAETQDVLQEFMSRRMQQGTSMEEFEANKDQLIEGATSAARERVKGQLILGEISKKEKIEVEDADIQQAIYQEAMQSRAKPEDIVKELRENRERLDLMRRNILFGKVLALLSKEAVVTEKEPEHEPSHDDHAAH